MRAQLGMFVLHAAATAACAGGASEAVGPVGAVHATTREVAPAVSPGGTWHLRAGDARLTMTVQGTDRGVTAVELRDERDGVARAATEVTWEAGARRLRFHAALASGVTWFDGFVAGAAVRGRLATTRADAAPAARDYVGQFTGWNASVLDRELVPRVYDLGLADGRVARVRIDRVSGALAGTFKVYARRGATTPAEEPERALRDLSWDGASLAFGVDEAAGAWSFRGVAEGRRLTGRATRGTDAASEAWSGERAEVFSFGLSPRTAAAQRAWATQVRADLARLVMAGAPQAASVRVVPVATLRPIAPRTPEGVGALPQAYTVSRVRLEVTLRDPRGGSDAARAITVTVARPTTPAPAGGYPLVLALNGHGGSAQAVMDPNHAIFGYGDWYARRGFVVYAVDVSHRPVADREGLYADVVNGDEPGADNAAHPAVRHGALSSDWEEDGERAWDVMRVLDAALAAPGVDRGRVTVTGLSLGAEVATWVGALDPRVTAVVAAGFSPDTALLTARNNHPCWRWRHGEVGEYVDTSDLHALVAPRLLVVETGALDRTFSSYFPPFASDKQVLRRARAAWGASASRVVHFLHDGSHVYRVGDALLDESALGGITVPSRVAPDDVAGLGWQTDPTTTRFPMTVFDLTRNAQAR